MPEAPPSLAAQIEALPETPGVYQFIDSRGSVLYIGKARQLRTRVRQYLRGSDERAMVPFLVDAAARIEATIVKTDKEACILESTLIQKHKPRFNVRLTDDSSFLHLRVHPGEEWPRYTLVRSLESQGARVFGPFASASRARATLEFIHRRFPLRTCTDRELKSRTRPCLLHQMKRCMAPCVELCSQADYDRVLQESLLFLEGRSNELIKSLQSQMTREAEVENFEEAARLRDLIRSIQATIERQHVVDSRQKDRDIWGLHRVLGQASLCLLPVRQGRMQEAIHLCVQSHPGTDAELLSTTLNLWYLNQRELPSELLLPIAPPDVEALTEILSERAGRKTRLRVPQRGIDRRWLDLAQDNARSDYNRRISGEEQRLQALKRLQQVARLSRMPARIECFDNSNIQGTDPVAAMAVFSHGAPDRARYRRYKVKTVVGSDDFATMEEILERRLQRGLAEDDLPELIVVDGGKGQLNAARRVLRRLGIRDQSRPESSGPLVDIIGIAKPRTEHARGDRDATDRLVLPDIRDPIRLRASDPALRMVQSIRDESHKTAVRFHRKRRRKTRMGSQLDGLSGIGPTRKTALLRHFKSVRAIRSATLEELCEVPGVGPQLAQQLRDSLNPASPEED